MHVMEKDQRLVFDNFKLLLTKFPFWEEDWVLGYHSVQ